MTQYYTDTMVYGYNVIIITQWYIDNWYNAKLKIQIQCPNDNNTMLHYAMIQWVIDTIIQWHTDTKHWK